MDFEGLWMESFVGLSLSSVMNVARYLSAETLPGLIGKVRAKLQLFGFVSLLTYSI